MPKLIKITIPTLRKILHLNGTCEMCGTSTTFIADYGPRKTIATWYQESLIAEICESCFNAEEAQEATARKG